MPKHICESFLGHDVLNEEYILSADTDFLDNLYSTFTIATISALKCLSRFSCVLESK